MICEPVYFLVSTMSESYIDFPHEAENRIHYVTKNRDKAVEKYTELTLELPFDRKFVVESVDSNLCEDIINSGELICDETIKCNRVIKRPVVDMGDIKLTEEKFDHYVVYKNCEGYLNEQYHSSSLETAMRYYNRAVKYNVDDKVCFYLMGMNYDTDLPPTSDLPIIKASEYKESVDCERMSEIMEKLDDDETFSEQLRGINYMLRETKMEMRLLFTGNITKKVKDDITLIKKHAKNILCTTNPEDSYDMVVECMSLTELKEMDEKDVMDTSKRYIADNKEHYIFITDIPPGHSDHWYNFVEVRGPFKRILRIDRSLSHILQNYTLNYF